MLKGCKNNKIIRNILMASFVFIVILSSLLMPFTYVVKANDAGRLPYDKYIGYIIEPIQIIEDYEYETNISSDNLSSISGNITNVNLIEYTSAGITGVTSSRPNGNGGYFQGQMSFNLTSTSTRRIFYKGLYKLTIILDDYYVGDTLISLKSGNVSLINQSSVPVNGNSVSVNFVLNSEVTNYSDQGLTLVVAEMLSLYNSPNNWEYPIESFNFIQFYWINNRELTSFHRNDKYLFPIYKLNTGDTFYRVTCSPGIVYKVVAYFIGINPGSTSGIESMFETTLTIQNFKSIQTLNTSSNNSLNGRCVYFEITNNTDSTISEFITYKYNRNIKVIPIFFNQITDYISTDFALNFGLSNIVLDNLDIIVNGSTSSNNSSNNLNNQNSQFASDSQQLMNIESGYNNDLNNQLENIDFTNPIANNPNFLSSADFVVTIFNSLIANNPLTIFILIICIILVGKRLFGK